MKSLISSLMSKPPKSTRMEVHQTKINIAPNLLQKEILSIWEHATLHLNAQIKEQ